MATSSHHHHSPSPPSALVILRSWSDRPHPPVATPQTQDDDYSDVDVEITRDGTFKTIQHAKPVPTATTASIHAERREKPQRPTSALISRSPICISGSGVYRALSPDLAATIPKRSTGGQLTPAGSSSSSSSWIATIKARFLRGSSSNNYSLLHKNFGSSPSILTSTNLTPPPPLKSSPSSSSGLGSSEGGQSSRSASSLSSRSLTTSSVTPPPPPLLLASSQLVRDSARRPNAQAEVARSVPQEEEEDPQQCVLVEVIRKTQQQQQQQTSSTESNKLGRFSRLKSVDKAATTTTTTQRRRRKQQPRSKSVDNPQRHNSDDEEEEEGRRSSSSSSSATSSGVPQEPTRTPEEPPLASLAATYQDRSLCSVEATPPTTILPQDQMFIQRQNNMSRSCRDDREEDDVVPVSAVNRALLASYNYPPVTPTDPWGNEEEESSSLSSGHVASAVVPVQAVNRHVSATSPTTASFSSFCQSLFAPSSSEDSFITIHVPIPSQTQRHYKDEHDISTSSINFLDDDDEDSDDTSTSLQSDVTTTASPTLEKETSVEYISISHGKPSLDDDGKGGSNRNYLAVDVGTHLTKVISATNDVRQPSCRAVSFPSYIAVDETESVVAVGENAVHAYFSSPNNVTFINDSDTHSSSSRHINAISSAVINQHAKSNSNNVAVAVVTSADHVIPTLVQQQQQERRRLVVLDEGTAVAVSAAANDAVASTSILAVSVGASHVTTVGFTFNNNRRQLNVVDTPTSTKLTNTGESLFARDVLRDLFPTSSSSIFDTDPFLSKISDDLSRLLNSVDMEDGKNNVDTPTSYHLLVPAGLLLLQSTEDKNSGTSTTQGHHHHLPPGYSWSPRRGTILITREKLTQLARAHFPHVIAAIQRAHAINYDTIVLTGGRANDALLQHVNSNVTRTAAASSPPPHVVIQEDGVYSAVRGALTLLKSPRQFTLNFPSPVSIGVGVMTPFIQGIHPEGKRVERRSSSSGDNKNEDSAVTTFWCSDVWDGLIPRDTTLTLNSTALRRAYVGAQPGQTKLVLPIFTTPHPFPKFVTDAGVRKACELTFTATSKEDVSSVWEEVSLVMTPVTPSVIRVDASHKNKQPHPPTFIDLTLHHPHTHQVDSSFC